MSKSLTASAVEKLRPDPTRRLEVPDGLLPGLYLIIQSSGKKSWAVRYRAGGKPRKLTLGPYPALELTTARDAARAAMLLAQKGADPAADKKRARKAAKSGLDRDAFESVARNFLERYAKPKNRSWKETARLLGLKADPDKPHEAENPAAFIVTKDSVVDKWSAKRMQEIRRRDIVELLDEIVDRGAPIIANRTLAALRRLFNWATERDIIPASPVVGAAAPSPEKQRVRVLSLPELRAAWLASGSLGWPFEHVVRQLILTGQRREEVAGMTLGEIDEAQLLWTIPADRAKNGETHQVPLSPASLAIIAGAKTVAGKRRLIFTTNGENPVSGFSRAKTKLDAEMLKLLKKEAVERGADQAAIEIRPWTFHDLRRTMSTIMHDELEVAPHVVEAVLNHISGHKGGVAGTYNRAKYARQKRSALEAWAEFVDRLVRPPAGVAS